MSKNAIDKIGVYTGFFTAFMIFATILYFITNKLNLHRLDYAYFLLIFAVTYSSIRLTKRYVKYGDKNFC